MKVKVIVAPQGIDLIREAVYAVDALKQQIADAEAVVVGLKADHLNAEVRLSSLIASGACTPENGCDRDHAAKSEAKIQPTSAPQMEPIRVVVKPIVSLTDETVPIQWRLAAMLLADPVLDYKRTAATLWGATDKRTAKNRVNGHIQRLRYLKVVETLGSRRFRVDRDRFAKLSGLFAFESPPP